MKMHFHPLALAALSLLASTSLLPASDLSQYREFHLGMALKDVAKQAAMEGSEARLISSRPARIEELDWKTNLSAAAASQADSVREIRFRFYDGSLFQMTVSYDSDRTSGLTDTDMTEALAGVYGPGSTPATKEMNFNAGYNSTVRVIAQWDDAQSLLSLVGFMYGRGFGVIVSSKPTLALAQSAIAESDRLDRVEAPQKALDLKAKVEADAEARDEKSRVANKPGFRP